MEDVVCEMASILCRPQYVNPGVVHIGTQSGLAQ